MQCGATSLTRVASARSAAQGAWSSAVKPAMNTSYRSSWKNATSVPLVVKVSPAVALKRVRAGRFTASVTAAQSFVGKYVVLQRYARTRRVEDSEARHAQDGEGRHGAHTDQLGRLPGSRHPGRTAPAAAHAAAGRRLLRASRSAAIRG